MHFTGKIGQLIGKEDLIQKNILIELRKKKPEYIGGRNA